MCSHAVVLCVFAVSKALVVGAVAAAGALSSGIASAAADTSYGKKLTGVCALACVVFGFVFLSLPLSVCLCARVRVCDLSVMCFWTLHVCLRVCTAL